MSEQTSQEPTMEEILASIRRIISEDEAPAEGAEAPVAEPEPVPAAAEAPLPIPEPEPEPAAAAAAPAFEPEDDDDGDLELTQKVETHGDLDFVAADPEPEAAAPPPPVFDEPAPAPAANLVSDHVAAAAAATFGQLSSNILMPAEGRTLEDVVREMLRPMLQQWLDTNLPGIVSEAVQAEVERISRGRVR
jgi:cell pole-organizing protein PopZ